MIVIGIMGEIASGKDTAVKILQDHAFCKNLIFTQHLSYSSKIDDVLEVLGITKPARRLKQDLGTNLDLTLARHEYSLTRALYADMKKKSSSHLKLVSGIRFLHQLLEWKELVPTMLTIYIDADEKTRWEHNNLRRIAANLDPISFEQFLAEHSHETERKIRELREYATTSVSNSGTYEEFVKELKHRFDAFSHNGLI